MSGAGTTGGWLRAWRRRLYLWRTLPPPVRSLALSRWRERPAETARRLSAALAQRPGRVVFICHGNIMRSAFAAAWVRQRHAAVPVPVIGAGTHARAGRAAQDAAIRAAAVLGAPLDTHTATPLAMVEPEATDLFVCMDLENEAHVLSWAGALGHRVFLVGDAGPDAPTRRREAREVLDPYGRGDLAAESAFRMVADLVDCWMARVQGPEPQRPKA